MADRSGAGDAAGTDAVAQLDVVIEIPRWSFLKRGSGGQIRFVSPLPCPFNYGSVREYIGCDNDYLDAIVLGPRLPRGTRVSVRVYGAVGLRDRGMYDDKLVCSRGPLRGWERRGVLLFMRLYGFCKRLLNLYRGRPGPTVSEGWKDARAALGRARPCTPGAPQPPAVPY
ncbi:MAG TPA: inorganic diphosphatase [Burkholderiales bacterium]|nr:inorganic diphosphatase [Burkholderiales bacterium]